MLEECDPPSREQLATRAAILPGYEQFRSVLRPNRGTKTWESLDVAQSRPWAERTGASYRMISLTVAGPKFL